MRQRDKTWFYSRPPFTHAHGVTQPGGWQAVGEGAACWAAEGPASWADNVAARLRTRKWPAAREPCLWRCRAGHHCRHASTGVSIIDRRASGLVD